MPFYQHSFNLIHLPVPIFLKVALFNFDSECLFSGSMRYKNLTLLISLSRKPVIQFQFALLQSEKVFPGSFSRKD